MRARTRNQVLFLLTIVIFGFLLILSRGYLAQNQAKQTKERDLYLPEAHYLSFIALGHNGLVSDLVLAKALTYYGSHYKERRTFSFKHLKKLFITAVKMDPLNKDAFLMAGNILSDIDVHDAIEVLKLGMTYHPQYWKFPEMIGYHYFYRLNDSYNAGKYYELAAQMPGHPPYVPSISGKLYQESGRYEEAIRVLHNFYSTTTDKRLKKSFKQSIQQLQEKLKNRDFLLKARVLRVIDAAQVEIRPDPHNPQFQSLRSKERLKVHGAQAFDMTSDDLNRRLWAHFQLDFARGLLEDQDVRVIFQREPDGQLKRDSGGGLTGAVILKNNRPYRLLEIADFPPPVSNLDPENVHNLIGKVVTLGFRVHTVEINDTGIYFHSAAPHRNRFSAFIPLNYAPLFLAPGQTAAGFFGQLRGNTIVVSGLAWHQNRVTLVRLYFPIQLNR
jgi:tetratricopeptide (TPR) repeat protein